MKFHLPLLGSVFLFLSQSLHGLPLRVLAWDETIAARKLAISNGKDATELKDLHPLSRSPKINVTGGDTPPMLQALDKTDAKGAPASDPIRIPANVTHPLALLMPDPKAATGIRTVVLEDDPAGFQWGTIRMINATGKELLFKAETKVSVLAAGWTPVDISLGGKRRNMEVLLALKEQPKQPLFSAIWEYRDDQRQLVFVIPNKDAGESPVDFKVILEDKADEDAAKQNAAQQGGAKPN
ncbi:hypothetical protein [Luteolibacter soli]|uniref:Uncharacterized protein n=1 Tax=Luteolibacter soli TaxID=3135280 RepID=A0ABU9AML4_9BACT